MNKSALPVIVMLLACVSVSVAHPRLNAPAPDFFLQDQHDRPFHLREEQGNVVVLLASDKEGEPQMPPWRSGVAQHYKPGIVIVGIADVRSAPFFMKSSVKNRFKGDSARILLDWKGEVFRNYALQEKMPNIIVIDKKGVVRAARSGEFTPETCDELFKTVDRLTNE